ncbi:MAG: hypothetical protein IJ196_01070 [Prevotella sp.]|nr:hypothetical protein [Prevotella sp.]
MASTIRGTKSPYTRPYVEVIATMAEPVMDATSWYDGTGNTLPVKPGDPDPDDDFKGAKKGNWDVLDNMWD